MAYDAYTQAGIDAGLSPDLAAYMPQYVKIESGGNPNAVTGSYSGLLQMGPDEIKRYGGNGLANGAAMYADRAKLLGQQLGRAPTPTELYLANQQGMGGIIQHMSNPDAPAWANMRNTAEGQQKGDAWAKKAIWGNIPDQYKQQFGNVDNVTSQAFMDMWKHKVEGTPMTTAMNGGQGSDGGDLPQGAKPVMYSGNGGGDGGFSILGNGGITKGELFSSGMHNVGNGLQNMGAWALAANNPAGGAALLNSTLADRNNTKPTWGQTGVDIAGNPQYGWINPMTGVVGPYSGPGAAANVGTNGRLPGTAGAYGSSGGLGSTGTPGQGMPDVGSLLKDISTAKANGTPREELLNKVPIELRSYVSGMLNGQDEPYLLSRNSGLKNSTQLIAHAIDPSLNDAVIQARRSAAKDMAPGGKLGQSIAASNQLVNHLGEMYDTIPGLNNGSVPIWNSAMNAVAGQLSPSYQTASKDFDTYKQAAASEMTRLLRGSGGAEADVKDWQSTFDKASTPDQLRTAIGSAVKIMRDRMEAATSGFNTAFGSNYGPEHFLSPKALATINRITGSPSSTQAPTDPSFKSGQSGQTTAPSAPPPQATQTATLGGKSYHKIGNQWFQD